MNSENRRPILIIDKSISPYSILREVLERNFHVIESNSDTHGLALARKIRPEVVICHISDSSGVGLGVCRNLKSDALTNHVSVILIGPIKQKLAGLQAGADGYISVPIDSRELMLKVKNMVRLREAMRGRATIDMSRLPEFEEISDRFIEKLEHVIIENISNPDFGVQDMAFRIGISVSVLYRKIRLLKGTTVNEFVKKIRMDRSMRLLEVGIYRVNEVASLVGYEDSKYFSKEFRKYFGKTPKDVKHHINKL